MKDILLIVGAMTMGFGITTSLTVVIASPEPYPSAYMTLIGFGVWIGCILIAFRKLKKSWRSNDH